MCFPPPNQTNRTNLRKDVHSRVSGVVLLLIPCLSVVLRHKLPLMIVPGSGPSLLGRNWLDLVRLVWPSVHMLNSAKQPSDTVSYPAVVYPVLNKYPELFVDTKGTISGVRAKFMWRKMFQVSSKHDPCLTPYVILLTRR
mgnify:CR=1 FL=1